MIAFFDTSVLVSAVTVQNPDHSRSLAVYQSVSKNKGYCATHTLAEVYSTLTRFPGNRRMDVDQVLFVLDDISDRLTPVTLDAEEYKSVIAAAASERIIGGAIYDALIAQCALKVKANVIYTWNVDHFRRCGPEIAKRVRTP